MAWLPQRHTMKTAYFVNDISKLFNRVIFDLSSCPREDISVIYELLVTNLVAPAVKANKLELVFFSFNDADKIIVYCGHLIFNEAMQ